MAKHVVKMTIPARELNREQMEFAVRIDDKPHGKLKVSNGSIVWSDKNKKYGYKMSWSDFAELMMENGKFEK